MYFLMLFYSQCSIEKQFSCLLGEGSIFMSAVVQCPIWIKLYLDLFLLMILP